MINIEFVRYLFNLFSKKFKFPVSFYSNKKDTNEQINEMIIM